MNKTTDEYLTPGQVAKLLMVSPAAVRLWAEKGELQALTTPGGHRRFMVSEVERFSNQRGLRVKQTSQLKMSVLIVDDDVQFARYLQKLLGKFSDDLEVDIATDGFDAGLKIREEEPDVVLLDLMMPGLDGFSVCKRIKLTPTTSDVRVIAMTGYPSEEKINKILAAGAEVCLSKPIDKDELIKVLDIKKYKEKTKKA